MRRLSALGIGVTIMAATGTRAAEAPRIEPLGVAVRSVTWGNSHGRLAAGRDGRKLFYIPYYSSTGSALVGIDARTGERVEAKLGSSGGYGLAAGADGALYVGGIEPGDLYRYDPGTGEARNLGGRQFECSYLWDCAASPDGKRIYAATYPKAKLLEYDLDRGELRDLGRMSETEAYCRAVCVDTFGKVWVGIGTRADLVVYDPATGERASVLPQELKRNSIGYALAASGEYVFCTLLFDGKLLVYDARTRRLVRALDSPDDGMGYMPAQGARPGEIYLYSFPGGSLYRYSAPDDRLSKLADSLGQCEVVEEERYVYGIDDQEFFLYDLKEGKHLRRARLAESREGMALMTLCAGPDGFIYGSTYINQHLFRVEPESGAIADLGKVIRWGGQVDSMCLGHDGRIYMGSYVHAVVSVYDPARPWQPGRAAESNPREIGRLGKGQYRTKACALGPDGCLYIGSVPSYNSDPLGAFSRVDPATEEITVWQDLVPGGAVNAVAADREAVYAASGGKLFVFDPKQGKPVWTTDLPVTAIVVAPTGEVVGTAGDRLFVFSPKERRVVLEKSCPVGAFSHMCLAPDGNVYGINGKHVARVAPGTWEVTTLVGEGGSFLAADRESNLYFGRGARVFRLRLQP